MGCAMFSIQLHIGMNSPLGQRLPLIQHIVGAAMVNSLKVHELYKVSNILKLYKVFIGWHIYNNFFQCSE